MMRNFGTSRQTLGAQPPAGSPIATGEHRNSIQLPTVEDIGRPAEGSVLRKSSCVSTVGRGFQRSRVTASASVSSATPPPPGAWPDLVLGEHPFIRGSFLERHQFSQTLIDILAVLIGLLLACAVASAVGLLAFVAYLRFISQSI